MKSENNIIITAYACEPYRGSEPEVGLKYIENTMRRNYKLTVITRENNRKNLVDYFKKDYNKIKFIYFDLTLYLKWFTKKSIFIHLYYNLWQLKVAKIINKSINLNNISIIHHLTFINLRSLFSIQKFNKKIIIGPISGGELIDIKFYKYLSIRNIIWEQIRVLFYLLIKYRFLNYKLLKKSSKILISNKDCIKLIPKEFHNKIQIFNQARIDNHLINTPKISNNKLFKLIFVGRLESFKGIKILLKIFFELLKKDNNFNLTIIGDGNMKNYIKNFINKNSLINKIDIIGFMKRNELISFYKKMDLMLFPSFRESAGLVVVEAMSQGMPTIGFDAHGVSEILNDTCGSKIKFKGIPHKTIIDNFVTEIIRYKIDSNFYEIKSRGCIDMAAKLSWHKIPNFYE